MAGLKMVLEANAQELARALERIGERAYPHVKEASRVTAERIAEEARRRVPRATGHTARGIHVEEARVGDGYVVVPSYELDEISLHTNRRTGRIHTQRVTQTNLPIWLEFGTKFKEARPYLIPAARLEESAHLRRVSEALDDAIDEGGLGD